uniref:Uncharacterized protein n=1 Tax=Caenorhabditis japonica TaxID=281687 RepID=A0A8R1ERP4_CAEJA
MNWLLLLYQLISHVYAGMFKYDIPTVNFPDIYSDITVEELRIATLLFGNAYNPTEDLNNTYGLYLGDTFAVEDDHAVLNPEQLEELKRKYPNVTGDWDKYTGWPITSQSFVLTSPYRRAMKSSPHRPSIELLFKRGLGSAEIARRLQISSSTVRILRRHFAGGPFILQQDWAPSHGSRSTLAVLEAHFPGFLDKNLWPASSPDLNTMDFSVWGMLEGKIAGKVFATVDDLKAALEVAWASIDDGYLRRTVNSVKKRLRACVKARGSNFEILL